jgi:hypothetical protein
MWVQYFRELTSFRDYQQQKQRCVLLWQLIRKVLLYPLFFCVSCIGGIKAHCMSKTLLFFAARFAILSEEVSPDNDF